MSELAFAVSQIMSPVTKYHHCVGKLPAETVASVEAVMNFALSADPYAELKQQLCRAYYSLNMQKVNDLLDLPNRGSEKPTVLMDNILSLWPDTTTKNKSKLLLGSQLANHSAELAPATDTIWSQSGGQVRAADVTLAILNQLTIDLHWYGWKLGPAGPGS